MKQKILIAAVAVVATVGAVVLLFAVGQKSEEVQLQPSVAKQEYTLLEKAWGGNHDIKAYCILVLKGEDGRRYVTTKEVNYFVSKESSSRMIPELKPDSPRRHCW